MSIFRPFTEIVLNITNPLCEMSMLIIFILTSISMLEIPDSLYEQLDDILVFFVNFIMFVQMGSSVAVFIKNVIMIIKMKIKKRKEEAEKKAKDKMRTKVTPMNTKPEAITSYDEENGIEVLEEKMHPPSAEISYYDDYYGVAGRNVEKMGFEDAVILEEKRHPLSAQISYCGDYYGVASVKSKKLAFEVE